MHYFYVRVVKAKELPLKKDGNDKGNLHPFVEVQLGNLEVMVVFEINENKKGEKVKGELMLAVWIGTQADEAFQEALHLDATSVNGDGVANIKSKVYLSPRLWCLRINVIEAQELQIGNNMQQPEIYVRITLGNVVLRTKNSLIKNVCPSWNEDLIKVHSRLSFDGGYHVLDELTHYSSDLKATSKELWKPSIGVLELGILNAQGLSPTRTRDGCGITDPYCVAKYGQKWIRTRTILSSFNPKWNEQYTWEVFDPCTVITIGVFDYCNLQGADKNDQVRDSKIGKVRIRLSTLETNRVYTHSYPLIVLTPAGVKKIGEIQLAVRFSCSSLFNILAMYSQPLLPTMHYLHPLTYYQIDNLRHQATQIVAMRLSRAEPPLRREVVEYMLDAGSNLWRIRRSKANYARIAGVLTGLIAIRKWFNGICTWKNPFATVLVHIIFFQFVCFPRLILSSIFVVVFLMGTWNYRMRPRKPPHMDIKLSQAERVPWDELDEEFDTLPTSPHNDAVRMRYDRLRSIGSRMQAVAGDSESRGKIL
ncbi:hypothetical protein P3L10_005742 [Capsicum annuum]